MSTLTTIRDVRALQQQIADLKGHVEALEQRLEALEKPEKRGRKEAA